MARAGCLSKCYELLREAWNFGKEDCAFCRTQTRNALCFRVEPTHAALHCPVDLVIVAELLLLNTLLPELATKSPDPEMGASKEKNMRAIQKSPWPLLLFFMTRVRACVCLGTLMSLLSSPVAADTIYVQTNLISDIPGLAANTDPNLLNPWGIAFPSTPFWISDNHAGVSTLYNGSGQPFALVVTIPPPGGTPPGSVASPTGVVFNGGSDFKGDKFIFATEDGTIAGWQGGTSAVLRADNSGAAAVYKGLALGSNASGVFIYAANFRAGSIDVFDRNYSPASLAGNFTDPQSTCGLRSL